MAIYEFIVNWWCQTLNKFCAANPKEKLHSEHGISSSSIFNMKKTRVIAHKQQTNERASEWASNWFSRRTQRAKQNTTEKIVQNRRTRQMEEWGRKGGELVKNIDVRMFIYFDVNACLCISHSACVNRIKLNWKCRSQVGKVLEVWAHDEQECRKKTGERSSKKKEKKKSSRSKQLPERQIVMICKMNKSWQKMRSIDMESERDRFYDAPSPPNLSLIELKFWSLHRWKCEILCSSSSSPCNCIYCRWVYFFSSAHTFIYPPSIYYTDLYMFIRKPTCIWNCFVRFHAKPPTRWLFACVL